MMAWFSRKAKTTDDAQATALQVRQALLWQIEKAEQMAGESDLSRFYRKDLIIGYVFGFLNQFSKTVGIDDENMHCMMMGSVLCNDVGGNDNHVIIRTMIRFGAPLREFAKTRNTVNTKSFVAGKSWGERDCEAFLHDPNRAPMHLVQFLVDEARIQQRGLNVDTNNIPQDPAFGDGYYRNVIKILVTETGRLADETRTMFRVYPGAIIGSRH
jgi:hypothetical protein